MAATALMFQGTGSDVGKTVLVAGLCRIAANRGLKVRPFKPQNMSNNAAVSADGGEIGRAQWLQSLAARVPSSVHMNPVLLKPQSDVGSQIILQGKVFGQAKGRDYQALKPKLMDAVMAHPQLQGLRRFMLATGDAHGLYAQYGFAAPSRPQTLMEILRPDIYQAATTAPDHDR